MPFASKAQQRYMFSKGSPISKNKAKAFAKKTDFKSLPEKKGTPLSRNTLEEAKKKVKNRKRIKVSLVNQEASLRHKQRKQEANINVHEVSERLITRAINKAAAHTYQGVGRESKTNLERMSRLKKALIKKRKSKKVQSKQESLIKFAPSLQRRVMEVSDRTKRKVKGAAAGAAIGGAAPLAITQGGHIPAKLLQTMGTEIRHSRARGPQAKINRRDALRIANIRSKKFKRGLRSFRSKAPNTMKAAAVIGALLGGREGANKAGKRRRNLDD